ncbi:MAG: NAD(P)-binding domain-containing protein [Candidatus Aenigmatarchaeota archaeon]
MFPISIIGCGYVGYNLGRALKIIGYPTIFYDVDEKRLRFLEKENFNVTKDLNSAIQDSELSFICVPTPLTQEKYKNYRRFDTSIVKNVCRDIYNYALKKSKHTIVIKSTIPPKTVDKILSDIEKNEKIYENIEILVNPEFLTEISESWDESFEYKKDIFTEDRYVIGTNNPKSDGTQKLIQIYRHFNEVSLQLYNKKNSIELVSIDEACWIKLLSNAILATKISAFNSVYELAKNLNIDPHNTARIVGMDSRIGMYGTIHGKAFGGKCLPKDLEGFLGFLEEHASVPEFLKIVFQINEYFKSKYGVRE